MFAQPGVEAAVGDQFGDEAARHDGPLVHIERHALQPGLARKVGGGLAGLDAAGDQRGDGLRGLVGHGQRGQRVEVAVERQPELPQHQPGRFVVGIGGAMPIGQ